MQPQNPIGVKPIVEKFLEPNYLFAMEWRDGFIFGRVIRRRICMYKPWPLIDSGGNAVWVTTGTPYQGPFWFRDPRNNANDILYLDATTNANWPWFFHGAVGFKHQNVLVYPRIPERQDQPGRFPELDPVQPNAGDRLGFITGLESPYEQPSDWLEWIIPPRVHVDVEFYNLDEDRNHRPVCNLLFALYHFQILNPDTHQNLIRSIALRQVPAAFFKTGFGDNSMELGGDIKKSWDATELTIDRAARL